MPDSMSDLTNAAQVGANIGTESFSPINKAIQNGNDYALSKASLDIQQQHAQNQKDQIDLYRKDFENKVNNQQFDELSGTLVIPGGKTRNQALASIQKKYENTPYAIHDNAIALYQDPERQVDLHTIIKSAQNINSVDPDVYNSSVGQGMTYLRNGEVGQFLTKGLELNNQLALLKTRNDMTGDRQQDKIDETNHRNVVNRIATSKDLSQRFNQFTNLQNALTNFSQADHKDPAAFDELQQAVRANLGIKGTSGVDERSKTQLNSLDIDIQRVQRYLGNHPGDIEGANELVKHVENLANLEQNNVKGQFEKALKSASAGFGPMYDRRPDLKAGLMEAIKARQGELSDNAPPTKPEAPPTESSPAAPPPKPAAVAAPKSTAPKPVPAAVGAQLKDRLKKAQDSGDADTVQRIQDTVNALSPEARKKMGF